MGRSQIRVSSNRSSEMRLHLNLVGTGGHCSRDYNYTPDAFRFGSAPLGVAGRRNFTVPFIVPMNPAEVINKGNKSPVPPLAFEVTRTKQCQPRPKPRLAR